jgi:hypothetical protein
MPSDIACALMSNGRMAKSPKAYNGRRVFRAGAKMLALMVGVTLLFAAVACGAYLSGGWNWVSVSMGLVAGIIGVGGIVEAVVVRIDLTDDALVVTDLTGRRRFAIGDIERISQEKGVPPAIRLKDGTWVKLPSVGSEPGNSVRAWLKHQR